MEGNSTHGSGLAGNTLQTGTFYTLIFRTLMDAAAARVCQTLTEADESLLNKQCFEFELTLYHIHIAATSRR